MARSDWVAHILAAHFHQVHNDPADTKAARLVE
jgi:hypothetical protein